MTSPSYMGTISPSRRSSMCLEHLLGDLGHISTMALDKLFDQEASLEKKFG